jgi:hypothetical protein
MPRPVRKTPRQINHLALQADHLRGRIDRLPELILPNFHDLTARDQLIDALHQVGGIGLGPDVGGRDRADHIDPRKRRLMLGEQLGNFDERSFECFIATAAIEVWRYAQILDAVPGNEPELDRLTLPEGEPIGVVFTLLATARRERGGRRYCRCRGGILTALGDLVFDLTPAAGEEFSDFRIKTHLEGAVLSDLLNREAELAQFVGGMRCMDRSQAGLDLSQSRINAADRSVISYGEVEQDGMCMDLRVRKDGAIEVRRRPRGIVSKQGAGQSDVLAAEPVASSARVSPFFLQNFQRAMDARQVRVEDGLAQRRIGRQRIDKAHAFGRREGEVDAFNLAATCRQQPASLFVEARVELCKTLDVDGTAMRQAKLPVARDPRCPNLPFAAVIIIPGVVRRGGADLKRCNHDGGSIAKIAHR